MPWALLPCLRLGALEQLAFPKAPYSQRKKKVLLPPTHLGAQAHVPAAWPRGTKQTVWGARDTRDNLTAGSTEDQFICSIPSSTKPENSDLTAKDEKAVSEMVGSAAPPLRSRPGRGGNGLVMAALKGTQQSGAPRAP